MTGITDNDGEKRTIGRWNDVQKGREMEGWEEKWSGE